MSRAGGCLILALVFLMAGLFLAPGSAPAEVKELRIGIGIDADTFNPQEQTTLLFGNICNLIYDDLFFQTSEGKLEPRLATDYEASPDGLTWTIHLRKGVKFSDGTPFNAAALKLTLDRALDRNMRVPLRFLIVMIKEATVVDDDTIQLHLRYPFAPLAATLSMPIVSPISPAAIEKFGQDVRQNPVGAGAYVFQEWVKGDRIVLTRNETYYGPQPTVEKIIFQIVPDAATREAMLRAGQLDICYKPLPSNVASLEADPNISLAMPLSVRTVYMGMNCQKGVTTNKLVRQAFNYAVDKKAICHKILFDVAVPMEGPCSQIAFGFSKMPQEYDYDPEKAKELLEKAGFDFSQTVHMRTCQGRYLFDTQVSEAVQAYLQAIGVKVELRVFDWPTYIAGAMKPLDQTELELYLLGWACTTMDADMQLFGQFHSSTHPPKGLGTAFYDNPAYDKAIEATRLEQDPQKRAALLKKAAEILWDDCPWIWLFTEKFLLAYRSDLEGLVVTPAEMFYPTYMTAK